MYYCLNTEELEQFIDYNNSGKAVFEDDLRLLIEYSQNWQTELGCIQFLFARVLARKIKRKTKSCYDLIHMLNDLEDKMYIRINECDFEFVEYMLRYIRELDITLEENIINLHTNMNEHIYE